MQCSLFYVEYEHRFQLAMMNGICFCISIKKPRKIKAWTLYTLYKYGDCAPRAHPARAATRKTLCIIGNIQVGTLDGTNGNFQLLIQFYVFDIIL